MNIFIITGGRIDTDFSLSYMKKHDPDCIIAADKGLEACHQMELMPDYIYGDFDSVKTEVYAFFAERIPERIHKYSSRKDETDTELALREAIAFVRKKDTERNEQLEDEMVSHLITILGATGTRLDHVLGNIQLLKYALDEGVPCELVDEHNRIRMLKDSFTIREEDQFGEYVSFLPFTSVVEGITLKGFEYDVEDWNMESGLARGVSNEIKEEIAEVSIKSGILLMFETRD